MKLHPIPKIFPALLAATLALTLAQAEDWWNKEWTARKSFTIDTTKEGATISGPAGTSLVLLRLHAGNFNFAAAREDGADLRIVTGDNKTVLNHQIEKWDALMNEAFVWVKVPDIQPDGQVKFWVYSGVEGEKMEEGGDPKETYDAESVLVYHFLTGTPADATKNANNATSGGTLSEGSLIGPGLRVLGNTAIKIPSSETFRWVEGEPMTLSAWVKSTTLNEKGILFDWADGPNQFQVGLASGVPYVEVKTSSGTQRTPAGDPVAANSWKHMAVVATNASITLFVDGKEYATLNAPVPALAGEATLGADAGGRNGLVGEIDEFQLSKTARGPGWVGFAQTSQAGGDAATKLIVPGEDEGGGGGGHSGALEHVMLFGDIAKNMMFDGWIAVGVCVVMMVIGWSVAAGKFIKLGKIEKGNAEFQNLWRKLASDLTAMDLDNPEATKAFGGKLGKKALRLLENSSLYHVYHVGVEEIRHRIGGAKTASQGLSARSIQALRAALDSSLVHEQHRLHRGMVYLTVSIAGGPYVGLLGTVVGVMITFAIIAKSGEVDVNSIAPGIASALLATTVGLLVAIPALFMYSFLNTRTKEVIASMQVFIDEFVAKVAEFYPTPAESGMSVPIRQIKTPEAAARQEELARDEEVNDERRP